MLVCLLFAVLFDNKLWFPSVCNRMTPDVDSLLFDIIDREFEFYEFFHS